jgi:hypothetical protein
MAGFHTVRARLGNMRKPQEFIVARTDRGNYIVQSDKSIGEFDPATGKGVLNTRGSYFPHLSRALGAKPYTFPPEFVQEAQERRAYVGEEIGPGMYYAGTHEIGRERHRAEYPSSPRPATRIFLGPHGTTLEYGHVIA